MYKRETEKSLGHANKKKKGGPWSSTPQGAMLLYFNYDDDDSIKMPQNFATTHPDIPRAAN